MQRRASSCVTWCSPLDRVDDVVLPRSTKKGVFIRAHFGPRYAQLHVGQAITGANCTASQPACVKANEWMIGQMADAVLTGRPGFLPETPQLADFLPEQLLVLHHAGKKPARRGEHHAAVLEAHGADLVAADTRCVGGCVDARRERGAV